TSRVRSVEPVSTTTISSIKSATDSRHAARFGSSLRTIMHSDRRGLVERSDGDRSGSLFVLAMACSKRSYTRGLLAQMVGAGRGMAVRGVHPHQLGGRFCRWERAREVSRVHGSASHE